MQRKYLPTGRSVDQLFRRFRAFRTGTAFIEVLLPVLLHFILLWPFSNGKPSFNFEQDRGNVGDGIDHIMGSRLP